MLPRTHYLKQPYREHTLFPQGLEQAGLSPTQARLVRKHGVLICALLDNQVADPSAEDQHLLKVIARRCNPKNPVEQAWLKYMDLLERAAVQRKSA